MRTVLKVVMWSVLDADGETDSPYDSCSGEAVDSAEKQREGGLAVPPALRTVQGQGWGSLMAY